MPSGASNDNNGSDPSAVSTYKTHADQLHVTTSKVTTISQDETSRVLFRKHTT